MSLSVRLPGLRARWDSLAAPQRRSVMRMAAFVLALHVSGFLLLVIVLAPGRARLGTAGGLTLGVGLTAYLLGLRHAFDADHIAAIDNVTRKLTRDGSGPLSVGFWFSLGHSTIVFALSALIAAGVRSLGASVRDGGSGLHRVAAWLGSGISAGFLYLIAGLNLIILVQLVRLLWAARQGRPDESELEQLLGRRGLVSRLLNRFSARIRRPRQMYAVGLLFGLGFDTATEVALLVAAGAAGAEHLPWYAVLCLPLLFAAGMSAVDTADGALMSAAYGWASANLPRRFFFNLVITALSVVFALTIGTIELGGLLARQLRLKGELWTWLGGIDLGRLGLIIVAMMGLTWTAAAILWRLSGLGEQRSSGPREQASG